MKIALNILIALLYISSYIAMHVFIQRSIFKGLEIKNKWASGLFTLFLIISGSGYIIARIMERFIKMNWLIFWGGTWIGILLIAFTVFVFNFIIGLVLKKRYKKKRTWVSLTIIFMLVIISFFRCYYGLHIKQIDLHIKNLPDSLEGYTITQLTDLHVDDMTSRKWLKKVVRMSNSTKPDLVVITGDLLDGNICDLDCVCEIMDSLESREGVYAIFGNHEYYSGPENLIEVGKRSRIKILKNQSIRINPDLVLIGLDDTTAERFEGGGPDLKNSLPDAYPGDDIYVLLEHRPDFFPENSKYNIHLQLSGHTHAGQIFPNDILIFIYMKYVYGLFEKNGTFLYTSSGTGVWGPRMRLISRSEVVKIVLHGN